MRAITVLICGMVVALLALVGCGGTQQAAQGRSDFDTFEALTAKVAEQTAAKRSVHFVLAVQAGEQSFTGNGDGTFGAKPAFQLSMSIPQAGQLGMRLVDDVLYLKLPQGITPGKPWVKIDPNGDDPISKVLGPSLRQLKQNSDPSQTLKQFEGAGVITAKAPEQLNGLSTTHYSITVDIRKAIRGLTDPELKDMVEKALPSGVDTFPLQLWLGQDNLPVRMIMVVPFENPSTQAPGQVRISIDYSNWGKPVEIAAPPADEVGELPR